MDINNINVTSAPFASNDKKRRRGRRENLDYINYLEQENANQLARQQAIEQQRISERLARQLELDKVFEATNNPETKAYSQEYIEQAQKKEQKKKGKQTKKSKSREAQEKAARIKQQRMMDALHEEALQENMRIDIDNKVNDIINNRQAPDFNNFNYGTDDTIYNQSWAQIGRQSVNLKAEAVEDVVEDSLDFIMSDDAELNKFMYSAIEEGNTVEQINARINAGRRRKDITEEQYNMAKNLLGQNKDYINFRNASTVVDAAGDRVVKEVAGEVIEEVADEGTENLAKSHLKKALSGRNLNALLNVGLSINDYNEAINAGDGVVKSVAKAGVQFVAGEALGAWMLPVALAKAAPSIIVSGVEAAQTTTRKMNSVSRTQVFGESYFQDTQQLATMRQAGMEMAKMSQYNLQQAIMGNEAQYMHRL